MGLMSSHQTCQHLSEMSALRKGGSVDCHRKLKLNLQKSRRASWNRPQQMTIWRLK